MFIKKKRFLENLPCILSIDFFLSDKNNHYAKHKC